MVQGNAGQERRSVRGRALALLAPVLLGAAPALALVACSAGVDGYYILEDGVGGGSGGTRASGGTSGQSGGRIGQGGTGGTGQGGTAPGGSGGTEETGGAGNAPGSGGSSGEGGTTGNGGTGTGGTGTGGTSTGGTATGGAGNGGTSTGGSGTGGTATGGGGGTGGARTFGVPTPVALPALSGITAAAFDGRYFWLLRPGTKGFYRLDPETVPATVTGPFPLPGTTVAPHVFGVSQTHVFIIADAKAYKVPRAGDANATGVTIGTVAEMPELVGAYASGFLLVGHKGGGADARAFKDDGTLQNVSSLGKVSRVATDGNSFAIARVNGTDVDIHLVAPPSFALNTAPCRRGSFTYRDLPITVFYSAVGWATPGSGSRPRLVVSRPGNGGCSDVGNMDFGIQATAGHPLALLDETHVVVADTFTAGSATVSVKDVAGSSTTQSTNVNLGGTAAPEEIIAGGGFAVIVGNAPVLLRF